MIDAITGSVAVDRVKDKMLALDARKADLERLVKETDEPPAPTLIWQSTTARKWRGCARLLQKRTIAMKRRRCARIAPMSLKS